MTGLLLSAVALALFVLPTVGLWMLGRRLRLPAGELAMGATAVWVTSVWAVVILGAVLSQRAQPVLFPETSPCHDVGTPVARYFPPDAFCLHADGELRTVNGPTGRILFWLACGTAVGIPVAARLTLRRHR
ncbi:hypothetical protein ACFV08_12805 [Streptomyces fradiae]|uniref:hypothetical protein n=1 Tax=Streptomyces fradiae TaxID=1906 RepID=UPI0036B98970